jgi:hypothetical protein
LATEPYVFADGACAVSALTTMAPRSQVATGRTVEIFAMGERITVQLRSSGTAPALASS